MKNIHLIPTDVDFDFETLYIFKCVKQFSMFENVYKIDDILNELAFDADKKYWYPQNMYITSDEEIKKGDWCLYNKNHNSINPNWELVKCGVIEREEMHPISDGRLLLWMTKIVLTTDQNLIKDGVQSIPDDFLEWFVKNPTCESVNIKNILQTRWGTEWHDLPNQSEGREPDGIYRKIYKIILPNGEDHFLERGITIIDVSRQKLGGHHSDLLKPVGEKLSNKIYSEEDLETLLNTILQKAYDSGEMFDVVSSYDIKKVFEEFKIIK